MLSVRNQSVNRNQLFLLCNYTHCICNNRAPRHLALILNYSHHGLRASTNVVKLAYISPFHQISLQTTTPFSLLVWCLVNLEIIQLAEDFVFFVLLELLQLVLVQLNVNHVHVDIFLLLTEQLVIYVQQVNILLPLEEIVLFVQLGQSVIQLLNVNVFLVLLELNQMQPWQLVYNIQLLYTWKLFQWIWLMSSWFDLNWYWRNWMCAMSLWLFLISRSNHLCCVSSSQPNSPSLGQTTCAACPPPNVGSSKLK